MLPPGHGPWFDTFRRLGAAAIIGSTPNGFVATLDAGHSWVLPTGLSPPGAPEWRNDTRFAVTDAAGTTLHNMGDLVSSVVGNVTAVSANASTEFTISADGRTLSSRFRYDKNVSFTGLPTPGVSAFRTGGASWVRLKDGSLLAAIIVTWARGADRASIVAFRSGDGGYRWRYAGSIARADDVESNEGPNENTLALLRNGSILCVMRLDAGDAGRYHRYASALSHDGGYSWTYQGMLAGAGAARPRLLGLNHSLLLSGGRTWNHNRDTLVWLNALGDGGQWVPHSISYWHNRFVANATLRFDSAATNNSDRWPRISNSYTSLVRTGAGRALVFYELKGAYGFAMPITLVNDDDSFVLPTGAEI